MKYFVKPAAGLKIRMEENGVHIPADGADVPDTPYYRRLLRDGDIQKAKKPRPEKAK